MKTLQAAVALVFVYLCLEGEHGAVPWVLAGMTVLVTFSAIGAPTRSRHWLAFWVGCFAPRWAEELASANAAAPGTIAGAGIFAVTAAFFALALIGFVTNQERQELSLLEQRRKRTGFYGCPMAPQAEQDDSADWWKQRRDGRNSRN